MRFFIEMTVGRSIPSLSTKPVVAAGCGKNEKLMRQREEARRANQRFSRKSSARSGIEAAGCGMKRAGQKQ
jgi:hypothetical protein